MGNGATSHRAFSYGTGLDGQLWTFLHEADGRTLNELHTLTGRPRTTVLTKLKKLRASHLAHEAEGRWYRSGNESTLDQIAAERGLDDRAERRAQRHQQERTDHLNYPNDWTPS